MHFLSMTSDWQNLQFVMSVSRWESRWVAFIRNPCNHCNCKEIGGIKKKMQYSVQYAKSTQVIWVMFISWCKVMVYCQMYHRNGQSRKRLWFNVLNTAHLFWVVCGQVDDDFCTHKKMITLSVVHFYIRWFYSVATLCHKCPLPRFVWDD